MKRQTTFIAIGSALAALFLVHTGTAAQAPPPPTAPSSRLALATRTPADVAAAASLVTQLLASRDLVVTSTRDDAVVSGRRHESLTQVYRGIPVYGGGLTRQLSGASTISVFGTIRTGIDVDPVPTIAAADAVDVLTARTGRDVAAATSPTLVVYPTPTGRFALAYEITMADARTYFVDAHSGQVLASKNDITREGQVGVGVGVLGDRKKMSTTQVGSSFRTEDQLRPAGVITLDTGGDNTVLDRMLNGGVSFDSDFFTDDDNNWTSGRVVDAHVNSGWVQDYFYKQHNWSGIDGAGGRTVAILHRNERNNAFFIRPPFGPGRNGAIVFGETTGGVPVTALDVAGHELMHAVTEFSLRRRTGSGLDSGLFLEGLGPSSFSLDGTTYDCDTTVLVDGKGNQFPFWCQDGKFILASNHGGAINEAFSDVIGTSIEFFYQPAGTGPLRGDYQIGEDVTGLGPLRSLSAPGTITIPTDGPRVPYPDHVSRRLSFAMIVLSGPADNPTNATIAPLVFVNGTGFPLFTVGDDDGGVHWNATILGHAFYLAVEGGTNATSGVTVHGVGAANRAQIERAFFRAMTELMPNQPDLPTAAFAVYQAAVDLYGASSPAANAVGQAMVAVGLLTAN